MTTPLRQVLNAFDGQPSPVSLLSLARALDIEPGVLRAMIDYWVRRGELRAVRCEGGETCTTCGGAAGCPFIGALPIAYERCRVPLEHTD